MTKVTVTITASLETSEEMQAFIEGFQKGFLEARQAHKVEVKTDG